LIKPGRNLCGKEGFEKKYHLVRWETITKPKEKGGLGVKDLRKMNISLLCKWWWKLENDFFGRRL